MQLAFDMRLLWRLSAQRPNTAPKCLAPTAGAQVSGARVRRPNGRAQTARRPNGGAQTAAPEWRRPNGSAQMGLPLLIEYILPT